MPKNVAICTLILVVLASATGSIEAANQPDSSEASDLRPLKDVLKSESLSDAESRDRRAILKPASRPDGDPDAIWWQAGFTKIRREWKPFEDSVAAGADADRLDEYRKQREMAAELPHPEWKLANWCRKNGMLEQERIHLLRAIAIRDPAVEKTAAYERLGFQRIGDSWISPQEKRDAQRIAAEIELSHKRWDEKLNGLLNGLQGSARQRMEAEKSLKTIDDPVAVPAIVSSMCMTSELFAHVGVKMLGQIRQYQASRALAGQAVLSPWKSVRRKATELLKNRKLEDFAPDLMLVLSKPIQTRTHLETTQIGRLFDLNWDYAWIDESYDTVRIGIRRLYPVSPLAEFTENQFFRGRQTPITSEAIEINSDAYRVSLDLFDQTLTLDYIADLKNESRAELNERAGTVLSECTGEPQSSDPATWWQWWSQYSSIGSRGQKNVVIVDERTSRPSVQAFARTFQSCLVAGTPIWTETGYVDIEKVRPGDRVLSKDIESGELIYKPVLQVTEREPTSVFTIRLESESIETNAGHHFWVSGEGWLKTRQLQPGQPIHTVTGTERVQVIEDEGRTSKVYNLVVADTHTYFVGKSMILSHDVLLPRPTNIKVPGLETP